MNEEIKILDYDKFKCIADKCKFTCCTGWDISIDDNTYKNWEKRKKDLLSKVKEIENVYYIDKETHEACPFLNDNGLCKIVNKYGESYLSSTCHRFPRIENVFENRKEFSLSCACPEVVEQISNINGKIKITSAKESNIVELKIREIIINIIQKDNFSLEEKLIVSFQILLSVLENEEFIEELSKFNIDKYINDLIDMYNKIELNMHDSIEEINNLFLDIIENYKEVPSLDSLLKNISEISENIKIEDLSENWNIYKEKFSEYNDLIENCIISKVFNSCISRNIEEIIISLEMIILEYLLTRYAVYLKYYMSDERKINISEIKSYIMAFSRIIGNNTEAVTEFLMDGFDDSILEVGYLCYIALF